MAGVPVTLCRNDEVDAVRSWANKALGHAEYSPNYQRLLEHGDAGDVGDMCAAGDEAAVLARLRSFRDAGTTDLAARVLPFGADRAARIESRERTEQFLASVVRGAVTVGPLAGSAGARGRSHPRRAVRRDAARRHGR